MCRPNSRYNRAPAGHSQADKGREKLLIASSILMPAVSRAYVLMEKIESNLVPVLIWNFSQLLKVSQQKTWHRVNKEGLVRPLLPSDMRTNRRAPRLSEAPCLLVSSPTRSMPHLHLPHGPLTVTLATGFLLAFGGCGGNSTHSTQPAPVTPAVVTVAGAAQTRLGGTAQFTATVTGGTSTAVTWQVNGVTGGSAASGTISASGLYTAPSALPSPNTVTIAAVNAAATAPGTLVETILNPIPTVSSATATQSGTTTTYTVDVMGTGLSTERRSR